MIAIIFVLIAAVVGVLILSAWRSWLLQWLGHSAVWLIGFVATGDNSTVGALVFAAMIGGGLSYGTWAFFCGLFEEFQRMQGRSSTWSEGLRRRTAAVQAATEDTRYLWRYGTETERDVIRRADPELAARFEQEHPAPKLRFPKRVGSN